jgi:excisionase family DNA binding protein
MTRLVAKDRPAQPEQDFLSVEEFTARTGLSRRQFDRMAASGQLFTVKVGRRRLVPVEAYEAWRRSLTERAAS